MKRRVFCEDLSAGDPKGPRAQKKSPTTESDFGGYEETWSGNKNRGRKRARTGYTAIRKGILPGQRVRPESC